MRFRVFVFSLLLLNSPAAYPHREHKPSTINVSFCDLSKFPAEFVRKQIRVRAIYSYTELGDNTSRLQAPACCETPGPSIHINFDGGPHGKLTSGFPRSMGVVLATFIGEFEGSEMSGFFFYVVQVENVEETTSHGNTPAWIPRNCGKSAAEIQAIEHPIEVTYCQLIKDPGSFVGKEIRVRGIYGGQLGFNPPECCPNMPVKISVRMGELDPHSEKLKWRLEKDPVIGLVVFTGVMGTNRPVDNFPFPYLLTVDRVDAVEATAPTLGPSPIWVPKNCQANPEIPGTLGAQ